MRRKKCIHSVCDLAADHSGDATSAAVRWARAPLLNEEALLLAQTAPQTVTLRQAVLAPSNERKTVESSLRTSGSSHGIRICLFFFIFLFFFFRLDVAEYIFVKTKVPEYIHDLLTIVSCWAA